MKLTMGRYLIWLCVVWAVLQGCRFDTPEADTAQKLRAHDFLTGLTSMRESDRFKSMEPAINRMADISRHDVEDALTSLRDKNVSTLIYVCIQTENDLLYRLSAPAKMVVETAAGAFPNIAYYYARVTPSAGLAKLLALYRRYPKQRLPICLALGEINRPESHKFLLDEIRAIKSAGGSVLEHLFGLKGAKEAIEPSLVHWMLEQTLDREEVIALAELNVRFTDAQIQALWRSGGVKRSFALESVLGDPQAYIDSLSWIVTQFLEAGNSDSVRQMLLSDTMRQTTSRRVIQYRDAVLRRLKSQSGNTD